MKYSLRSLMIGVFLVAVCAGWFADHMRLAKEVERLQEFEGRWRASALLLIDIMNDAGWEAEVDNNGKFRVIRPSSPGSSSEPEPLPDLPNSSAPAPIPP